ncbi:hypothetical protein BDM02DRAFT_1535313 [Thelephora ganbajun]|uniref:Uncharacterized protein n=1 Tax=Thelephora ganbajun TaxID=370292 RepID=A0ACB6ZKE7_THEGA|nr:hypothetical protein BDM02DRAFT_1535313 [Thelephora ganbajun]
MVDEDDKTLTNPTASDRPSPGLISRAIWSPFTLTLRILTPLARSVRPWVPQLIPLLVGLSIIPLLVLLSTGAGLYVWKTAAVSWETPLFLQYGDGIMPYAEAPLPALAPRHPYDLSLDLIVPTTETNIALGNFMATLTLTTTSNKTLASIRRSAIVVPGALYSLTHLLQPGTSKLKVPLLDNFATGTNLVIAKIDLGRRDGWKGIGRGEGRELSVYSATLRGTLRHHGMRGLVTRFPVFSGFVAGTTFFFISSSCLAALLLPMVYGVGRPGPEGYSPARSDFSPKRESKSPGTSKPRSRVRYEDDGKQLRRQRQYTAGGVGSSRSRSNKSSRRSLVGPPCRSAENVRFTSTLVQQ